MAVKAAPGIDRLPVSTHDTGNQGKRDTGNPSSEVVGIAIADLNELAILASKELGNERFDESEWRIEVYTNRNGRRYWNHRRRGKRGGKDNWRYGGRFDSLDEERQAQYWQRTQGG